MRRHFVRSSILYIVTFLFEITRDKILTKTFELDRLIRIWWHLRDTYTIYASILWTHLKRPGYILIIIQRKATRHDRVAIIMMLRGSWKRFADKSEMNTFRGSRVDKSNCAFFLFHEIDEESYDKSHTDHSTIVEKITPTSWSTSLNVCLLVTSLVQCPLTMARKRYNGSVTRASFVNVKFQWFGLRTTLKKTKKVNRYPIPGRPTQYVARRRRGRAYQSVVGGEGRPVCSPDDGLAVVAGRWYYSGTRAHSRIECRTDFNVNADAVFDRCA